MHHQPGKREGTGESYGHTGGQGASARCQHQPYDLARLRSQRHANPNLPRALPHDIREHARNPDGRHQQRQQTQSPGQRGGIQQRLQLPAEIF